jgi:cell division protein FtsW
LAKKLSSDLALFAVTAALLGFGLVMVWSASSVLAQEQHGNAYHFLLKQASGRPSASWPCRPPFVSTIASSAQPRFVFGAAIVTTLLLILVLFLKPVNETHRWIRLGILSFQPAELAKLSLVLYLASHIERRGERINEFLPSLFPVLLLLGWFAFLVFVQPDLGSAAILVITAGVMLFMAGVRLRYFAALTVPAGALLYFAVTGAHYRWARIVTFFNPWRTRGAAATRSSRA